MSDSPLLIDLKTHDDMMRHVVEADRPAILDFWASWCGPCKATAPAFEAAAKKFEGQVTFCKVNTEQAPELAQAFNIRSIPTIALMIGSEVVDVRVGAARQPEIEEMASRLAAKADKRRQRAENPGVMGRLKAMFGG